MRLYRHRVTRPDSTVYVDVRGRDAADAFATLSGAIGPDATITPLTVHPVNTLEGISR
jgi:hypothetical protein